MIRKMETLVRHDPGKWKPKGFRYRASRYPEGKWKPKGFRYGYRFWMRFCSGERENRHNLDGNLKLKAQN